MGIASAKIPLRQRSDCEPLSPAASCLNPEAKGNFEKNWAQCEGYDVLKQEMFRYCCGEIRGQSLLVAGHRGAGKTLLTHLAIQVTRWRAEGTHPDFKGSSNAKAIPFLVPIHGPDLLDATSSYSTRDEDKLATGAMHQILLALQKSFKEELLSRFRAAFSEPRPRPGPNRTRPRIAGQKHRQFGLSFLGAFSPPAAWNTRMYARGREQDRKHSLRLPGLP